MISWRNWKRNKQQKDIVYTKLMKHCDVAFLQNVIKIGILLPSRNVFTLMKFVVRAPSFLFNKRLSSRNTMTSLRLSLRQPRRPRAVSRDGTKKSRAKSGPDFTRYFFVPSWLTAPGSPSTKYHVYRNVSSLNPNCISSLLLVRRPSAIGCHVPLITCWT